MMALTCGAGAVNILAFGVFLKPITQDLGVTRGDIGRVQGLTTWLSVVATPILGVLLDKYGSRRVLIVGAPLFALVTALQALMTPSFIVMFVLFALKGTFSAGISPSTIGFSVAQWFDRRRGLALGVAMSGVGLGTAFWPRVIQWMIDQSNWRTAFVGMGCLMLLLSFVPVLIFMRSPSDEEKASHDDIPRGEKPGVTFREATRDWRYWSLGLALIVGITGINGVLTQVVAILTDRGVSPQEASLVLGASGVASICGRLASGWLADRIFAPYVISAFYLACVAGTSLIGMGLPEPAPFIGVLMVAAALGCEIDLQTFLVSRYFGIKHLGKIGGLLFGAIAGATGLGGFISGEIFDHYHSYTPAFIGYGVAMALACVVFLSLGPYPFPAGAAPSRPNADDGGNARS
jgi:predicted MFS family arabinose efflux permease